MSDRPTIGHVTPAPGEPCKTELPRLPEHLRVPAAKVVRDRDYAQVEADRDRLRAALESLRTECQEQADSWDKVDEAAGRFHEGRAAGSVKAYRRIAELIDAALNPPAKGDETDD